MRRSKLAITAAMLTMLAGGYVVYAQQYDANGERGAGQTGQTQTRRQSEFDRSGQNQTSGQSQTQTPYRAGFRGQGQPGMTSLTDWQIVEWLDVDNQNEIAMAEIAEQKASSDEVKKFARQMAQEHSDFGQKLDRTIGNARNGRQQRQNGQFSQGRPQQQQGQFAQGRPQQQQGQFAQGRPPQRGQFAQGGMQQQGLDLVALKHQLGEQCRQSATRELQQKSGSEFDKCYIGMQIAAHMEMLDTLKVMSRYASPELDQVIEKGEETTQQHLEHAKKLIASLEGRSSDSDSSSRSARRESRDESSESSESRSKR